MQFTPLQAKALSLGERAILMSECFPPDDGASRLKAEGCSRRREAVCKGECFWATRRLSPTAFLRPGR